MKIKILCAGGLINGPSHWVLVRGLFLNPYINKYFYKSYHLKKE